MNYIWTMVPFVLIWKLFITASNILRTLISFRNTSFIVYYTGDGRKDIPGHCEQYCSCTFMEYETKTLLCIITMEKACFMKGILILIDSELHIVEFVTDAQVQVASAMSKFSYICKKMQLYEINIHFECCCPPKWLIIYVCFDIKRLSHNQTRVWCMTWIQEPWGKVYFDVTLCIVNISSVLISRKSLYCCWNY